MSFKLILVFIIFSFCLGCTYDKEKLDRKVKERYPEALYLEIHEDAEDVYYVLCHEKKVIFVKGSKGNPIIKTEINAAFVVDFDNRLICSP